MNIRSVKKIVHGFFTIFTVFYILTGFGITSFQIITPLTFGLVSKATAFYLHTVLIYPFIAFLLAHLFLSMNIKKWWKKIYE